jgi:hypothetical protein
LAEEREQEGDEFEENEWILELRRKDSQQNSFAKIADKVES